MPIVTINKDAATGNGVDIANSGETLAISSGVLVMAEAGNAINDTFGFGEMVNYGQLVASASGIELEDGSDATVVNDASGSITGNNGVFIGTGGNSIENDGRISGFTAGVNDFRGLNAIYNYGQVTGNSEGIVAGYGDVVFNSGSIVSRVDGLDLDGVTAFTSTFDNNGVVRGASHSIFSNGGGAVKVTNTGTLD